MKVGDLIRFRSDWTHANHEYDENGVAINWDVISPRTDDEGWSNPVLVVERWEGMWICLEHGVRIVINPNPGTVAVEVVGLEREIEELAMNFVGD